MTKSPFPNNSVLVPLIVAAIKKSNGRAHFKDIENYVATELKLTDQMRSMIRKGGRTEFAYRLSWARTAAASEKLIKKDGAGYWSLFI
jgi:restriction endonuclease Mrr